MPTSRKATTQALKANLAQAQRWLASGQHAHAAALLEPVLAEPSLRPEALYLSAVAAMMDKRVDAALPCAHAAVEASPEVARYWFVLGRALKAAEDRTGAEAAYRRAIALQSDHAEAMVSLGIVLKDQDRYDEAIALYDRALAVDPRLAAAHANRAHALALRAERRARDGIDPAPDDELLEAQGRAVALDLKNPRLHRNYGVLLLQARRHGEAVAAFNTALALDPSDVECCLRLGDALQELGAVALEAQAYRQWLSANPANAQVMCVLAGALARLGEADEALVWAEKSLALDPDPLTELQIANVLQQLRRVPEAMVRGRRAIDAGGRVPGMYPNYLLGANYFHEEPEPLFELHAEFGCQLPVPTVSRPSRRTRAAGERLRIGYVSGDFLRHSVAYFIEALLAHHDRERCEVVCYQNNAHADEVTQRLQGLAERWTVCAGWSEHALRSRILADGIDVLIDLSGHTAHSRLMMFATPCAPLQIGYLGYPTVSGVPGIDFRITDPVIDPGDMPPFVTEAPLRLPRTMFCYTPDPDAPPLAPPPALGQGVVTFGSFNNIAKVTDHTLELWAAVMRAVPGSRLLLKATTMAQASNRAGIERFMGLRGIAPDRLTLIARTPSTDSHLAIYQQVDIALDTFPYNGATTTCEALWMGVPVVSLRGRTHASRMGASILSAIGRDDCVAHDDAGYVERAVALATDLTGVAAWRAAARDHLRAGPLLDGERFTRDFEAVIEQAWQHPR